LTAKGVAVVNLLQLQPDETVSSIVRVPNGTSQEQGYLLMTTTSGVVKKTSLTDYNNIRTTGLIAIKLDDKDELKWSHMSTGNDEILISTAFGQAIRFSEKDIRPMGRAARGVRGIRLRPNDRVVGMDIVDEQRKVLVLSVNGYGKLTKVVQFPTHKRGGIGIKAAVVNSKTGELVTVRSLPPEANEVIIISSQGQTIRLTLKDVPLLGRATQGVRLMRLDSGDTVASFGILSADDAGVDIDDAREAPSVVEKE